MCLKKMFNTSENFVTFFNEIQWRSWDLFLRDHIEKRIRSGNR